MGTFERADHWDEAALRYRQTAHEFTSRFARSALQIVDLSAESRVLDVAAGTGALAFAAAETGASVLATDFSPGMIASIDSEGVPNVEARVMDGQALDLPDATFDAVFSFFGVIMFPNWRGGLAEMRRVTRAGGVAVLATWEARGAATFLLLGRVRERLFPEREGMQMPEGVVALSRPENLATELVDAGFQAPRIERVTHDFELDVAALDDPDTLFGMSPDWADLSAVDREAVIAEVRRMAGDRPVLPVPSTALIATAVR